MSEQQWLQYKEENKTFSKARRLFIDYYALRADYEAIISFRDVVVSDLENPANSLQLDGLTYVLYYAEMQRLLSNLLGSASAFRDRTISQLASEFGVNSEQLSDFKRLLRDKYDSNFDYRLMYNLRNFSQHHDYPISVIPISYNMRDNGESALQVNFMLDKGDLITSSKVQASFRSEIERLEENQFDLVNVSTKYIACFGRIFVHLVSVIERPIRTFRRRIDEIFNPKSRLDNSRCIIVDAKKSTDGQKVSFTIHHFPEAEIDYIFDEFMRSSVV